MNIKTINPANEEIVCEYKSHTLSDIESIIDDSHSAFKNFKLEGLAKRNSILINIKEKLLENKVTLATIISTEMGKPITQAIQEIEKSALVCDYYAQNSEEIFRSVNIKTEKEKSYIYFEPKGIILAIMPWNFPFWQVFRFAASNLAIGNSIILKHAPSTTGCALAIEELLLESGLPENVFRSVLIDPANVPSYVANMLSNKKITGVTVTGSRSTGSAVAAIAGKNIKKSVLELGGSDPYIIFEDADLLKSVNTCVTAKMSNCGQTCISAKRFIVHKTIYKDFLELMTDKMNDYHFGNPLATDTNLGPMARSDLRISLHNQVKKSSEMGAKIKSGGFIPDGKGYYYPPTILENIPENSPAYNEELFGPVAVFFEFNSDAEAVTLANQTEYGLGASIFTSDKSKAEHLATDFIMAGTVYINDLVKSDPRLPFGGIKNSGYGRELSGIGALEFSNIKTIVSD